MQRYIMRLAIFDYTLKHREGKDIGNADCLSRLPMKAAQSKEHLEEEKSCEIKSVALESSLNLDLTSIRYETSKDSFLKKVRDCVLKGWSDHLPKVLKHFHSFSNLLSVECGCILYGSRVIVPKILRNAVLPLLHAIIQELRG